MKRPQCNKCLSPELQPYYKTISKMQRAYIRDNEVFKAIGWYCKKCHFFLEDNVYNNTQGLEEIVYNNQEEK